MPVLTLEDDREVEGMDALGAAAAADVCGGDDDGSINAKLDLIIF